MDCMKQNTISHGGAAGGRMRGRAAMTPLCAAIAIFAVAGCGPKAVLNVTQPTQPPPINQLKLESNWASFDAGERDRYLLSFPLPGAVSGDRVFFVYLDATPDREHMAVSPPTDGNAPASGAAGFFLQMRGHNAGLSKLKEGKLEVSPMALTGDQKRRIEVWAECEDGTVISGRATAKRAPLEIRDFVEDAHAVEVRALYAPPEALAKDTAAP